MTKSFSIFIAGLFFIGSCTIDKHGQTDQYPRASLLIEDALQNVLFTGAVLLIGSDNEIVYHKAYGYATLYDEGLRVVAKPDSMTTGHLFDIASLTKIFATTYGLMALHSDGKIELDDPVINYFSEFDKPGHRDITIRHLLSHTSGLVQWYPTYYVADNAAERRSFTANHPLQGAPGENRRYSDLGFMLLGDITEQAAGVPMSEYLDQRIYSKLGLNSTRFTPNNQTAVPIVSTSHGNPFENKMVYDPDFGYSVDIDPDSWTGWREYTLKGEVSDGNAYYSHSGTAGHAGLFSTAEDLYTLLRLVINGGVHQGELIIRPETIEQFTTEDQFRNGLGWAMEPSILNAKELPSGSVGHTGFTGTNFVVSITDGLLYILLTNRQHVGVDSVGHYPNLRSLREEIAFEIFYNKDLLN
jgi:CubicO group peptidase (beta-lactamase class C family)